jgi:hypothetical protein
LPSIWGILVTLFPGGIKLPTFTSLTAGPYKGAGPIGKHPTLNVDLDAIISGGQGEDSGVGAPDGNASSQITSKLETALRKIVTFPPGNLEQGLADVKVRRPHDPMLSD